MGDASDRVQGDSEILILSTGVSVDTGPAYVFPISTGEGVGATVGDASDRVHIIPDSFPDCQSDLIQHARHITEDKQNVRQQVRHDKYELVDI